MSDTSDERRIEMTDKDGPGFEVRRYAKSDRPRLEAMYADFRPKRAAQGLPPENALEQGRWLDAVLDRGIHLVARVDGRLAGHAMLIPVDDTSVELANFVHQSVRNRGIGTALSRVALDEARRSGYERVWLSVEPSNRAAVRSYRKVGFRTLPGSLAAPEIEMEAEV